MPLAEYHIVENQAFYLFFKNLSSYNGLGLEPDICTKTERNSYSNIQQPLCWGRSPFGWTAPTIKQRDLCMQGQWAGREPMVWTTLGGRGRTAQDLEAWNELIQVSGSEGCVSNFTKKVKMNLAGVLVTWRLEMVTWRKRLSDKLDNRGLGI